MKAQMMQMKRNTVMILEMMKTILRITKMRNKSMKNLCKYDHDRSVQPKIKHTEQGSGFGIGKPRMKPMTVIMLKWTKLMVILLRQTRKPLKIHLKKILKFQTM